MTDNNSNFKLLDSIRASCSEIQQALNEHLEKTSNQLYQADISKDVVTLENLKLITVAVRDDIESGNIGAGTELLLRIAANDFVKKLKTIPEKKALIKEVTNSLKEIHQVILQHTIKRAV